LKPTEMLPAILGRVMGSIQSAARILDGDVSGSTILCPGPGHSKHDRSLSVTFDANAPDGFLVHSFANDNWQDCRDYVKDKLGIVWHPEASNTPAAASLLTPVKLAHMNLVSNQPAPKKPKPGLHSNTPAANKIWQEATTAAGSPVEAYLHGRGLTLAIETYSCALRYHPSCLFKGEIVPVMVAAMTDIHTNEFRGIHRTRLNPKKKEMLGPAKGTVVKLTPDEDVTYGLHICEGIETGLALMEMGFKPLWSCLTANGMTNFPALSGIEALTIFADNDENKVGQNAAIKCGARWQVAGKEVNIFATPKPGTDFADWMVA
jgi:putative DNA primase/helicase